MAVRPMKDAVPEDDYERMERGLPPIRRPEKVMPEAAPLPAEGQLDTKALALEGIVSVVAVIRKPKRNRDGVLFTGFDVTVQTKKGSRTGWISEGDYWPWRRSFEAGVDTRGAEL